ncbi:MAG: hypothetical protein ACRDTD_08735, partial [Pseudonocardiaceae bacterium]
SARRCSSGTPGALAFRADLVRVGRLAGQPRTGTHPPQRLEARTALRHHDTLTQLTPVRVVVGQ